MCRTMWIVVLVLITHSTFVCTLLGETYAVKDQKRIRRLQVVREYLIPVRKGQPSVAALPALMSFWGASNWQSVKSSDFDYQEEPDSIRITADNRGMPRRYFELTWNAPKTDKIHVKQTLDVELMTFSVLYTRAKLPYAKEVLNRYATSLVSDVDEGINLDNPDLQPICEEILKHTDKAEEVVELVCDWINENIQFEKGQRTFDEALAQKRGNCTSMSELACALLRRMGIPTEMVSAKFIGGDSGHAFVEVYFPDTGWVFYDLSNWNRGFKSLDCLITVGWSYQVGAPGKTKWINGYFCDEIDTQAFKKLSRKSSRRLRMGPKGQVVAGVQVKEYSPPSTVRIRHVPISQLIMDLEIPPGTREYVSIGRPAPANETALKDSTRGTAITSEIRTWTSRQGTTIQARFVSMTGDQVVLETEAGKRVRVELSAFSPEDQKHIRDAE